MTVQEVIRALEAAGWRTTNLDEELHQLQRDGEALIVTIAGKLDLNVPLGVQRVLWHDTRVEEND